MINPIFKTVLVSYRGMPIFSQSNMSTEYIFGKLGNDRGKKVKTKIVPIEEFLDNTGLFFYESVTTMLGDNFWDIVRTFDNEFILLRGNNKCKEKLGSIIGTRRRILQTIIEDEYKAMLYKKNIITWKDLVDTLNMGEKKKRNSSKKTPEKKKYNVRDICLLASEEIMKAGDTTSSKPDMDHIQRAFKQKNIILDHIGIVLWVRDHSDDEIESIMN